MINKEQGPTSHDVVEDCRRFLGKSKIGHTGTLDPAAAGLLVLLVGRATRLAEYVSGYGKAYRATMRLGITTDTDDAIGEILEEKPVPGLSVEEVGKLLERFRGKITQKVPVYSAVKVNGERLYRRARRGAEVDVPSRQVEIFSIGLVEWDTPSITFDVECSSGTYVRALARDIGAAFGCGAHLTALTRTRVGPYELARAIAVEELAAGDSAAWRRRGAFIPTLEMLPDFPAVEVPREHNRALAHGGDLPISVPDTAEGALVKLVADGNLAAVGRVTTAGVHPVKVFIGE